MAKVLFSLSTAISRQKSCCKVNSPLIIVTRNNRFFKQFNNKQNINENDYKYEVSKDPSEWKYVEQLMPFETVPVPTVKPVYPSGWRPMNEESLKLPYFVERSRNHMLSVYLKVKDKGQYKITVLRKIHGNIWSLHDELKADIQKEINKKVASYVHEGNNLIYFKGDLVYYVEQWLLRKGF